MALFKIKNNGNAWTINGDTYTNDTLRVYGDAIADNITNLISNIDTLYSTAEALYSHMKRSKIVEKTITVTAANAWTASGVSFTTKANCFYGLYCGTANRGFQLRSGTATSTVQFEYFKDFSGSNTATFPVVFYSRSALTYNIYLYPTAASSSCNVAVYEICGRGITS